ncbi:unnamed protein product [Adineta ricciae]|uniref:G-protein coupled receptors family 1 profile domain-containing protein n=2 Tax=Adineta ricciae TaxID=249248 RepID=A0A815BZF1_ADIRI|nr:unnamed protein product [Adineta ricciae]
MNTSIVLTIYSIISLETLLIPSSSLTSSCKIRHGYFISTSSLSVVLSYILQAFYRLVRIAFSSSIRSKYIWISFIIIQWFLSFCFCLPFLLIEGFISYIPFDQSYCVTTYRNLFASIYGSLVIYIFPLIVLIGIYGYVIWFLKRSQRVITFHQQRRNQRDLIVIKRIVFIVNGLICAGLPSMILWMIYLIKGNLIEPLIYEITWLSVQLGIVVENILLIYFTREIRSFLKESNIVHF